jgi:CrcB protein
MRPAAVSADNARPRLSVQRRSTLVARLASRVLGRLSVGQARLLMVMSGGAVGTLGRAGLAEALPHRPSTWPWATFVVNLMGAFIFGWLLTWLAERSAPSRHWRFLLGTGFCGAVTTFSTFQIETFQFARSEDVALAVSYPIASIAAGMAVAVAGVIVARWGRHW